MANLFNYRRPQVANQRTGYRNRAWLGVATLMSKISEPAAGSTGAAAVTVVDDHEFTTGNGFIEVYCLPKSVTGEGESSGDAGAMHINWKPKFFIPGDTAALQAMIENGILNEDLILIVEDATCPDGGLRQYGCECNPVNMTSVKFESGDTSQGRKGWAVESEASCRFFYTGEIVKMPG